MIAKDNLKILLRELNAVIGVSGHEEEVVKAVYERIKDHVDEIHVSTTGNIVAVKRGQKTGPSLMIAAHMDEVGYIVRNILPSGFLTLDKIGFAPDSVLAGRKVMISEKRIPGVVGTKPGHLMTPEERNSITPLSKCYVDVGVSSAAEVKALGIKIGDQVVINSDFMEMANPDLICTRAIDNRIGCAVIIELLRGLNKEEFTGTVYGVFTVREEVGLLGAQNAIFGYDIDYAIGLDTVPVADTPEYSPANDLPMYLGKGPGFPVCEFAGTGYFQFVHPSLRAIIEKCAQTTDVNLQTVSLGFASYVTDSTSFAYSKKGLPTATLSIPRRYSHSPVELMNMTDAVDLLNLLREIVRQNGSADLSFVKL